MKNLPLILSTVLLVAVSVLYYLHFSANGSTGASSAGAPTGNLVIAYIRTDSLLSKYEFVKERQGILEAKSKKLDSDYRNRAQSLQNEVNAYQRNRTNLTIGQDQALQQDLTQKSQNLQLYEQSLSQELMGDQAKMQKELYDRITGFLSKYAKENGLQVILKYDPTSDVLFGIETLDVTEAVVTGLNSEYKNEKEGGNVKGDTTVIK